MAHGTSLDHAKFMQVSCIFEWEICVNFFGWGGGGLEGVFTHSNLSTFSSILGAFNVMAHSTSLYHAKCMEVSCSFQSFEGGICVTFFLLGGEVLHLVNNNSSTEYQYPGSI